MPLTNPAKFGGDPADAFHVVILSIPGFGFSGPTVETGWDLKRVAKANLPEDAVDLDQLLTHISLYWFTGTAASSSRLLYETTHAGGWPQPPVVPTGIAVFAGDNTIRKLAKGNNDDAHWTEFEKGGHFPAMEAPDLFVKDIRAFFKKLSRK